MSDQNEYSSQQMAFKLERERLSEISEMRIKSEIEFLTDILLRISAPYEYENGHNPDQLSQMHCRLEKVRIDATMRIAELGRGKGIQ